MGLWGRLEATKAPTRGKARKGTETSMPLAVRLELQLLGTCAERARTNSAMLPGNIAKEKVASDHASLAAARVLTLAAPCSCTWKGQDEAPVPIPGLAIQHEGPDDEERGRRERE